MENITNKEWKDKTALDPEGVILDVRTQEEVDEGKIPNSVHHDIYDAQAFMQAVEGMDPDKNYYVYCRSGGRSKQACKILEKDGKTNTFNLKKGFSQWDGEVEK